MLFGAYLFFWYLDWMEKTRRTIDVGERWLKDPLFFKDEIVGSLLYRPTHPAPLERARHIGFRIHQKFNGNPRLQQLFNVPGNWLAILFDLLWADNRQLIKLIRESKAKVHPKWVQSLPEIGIALGMNHGNKTVIY